MDLPLLAGFGVKLEGETNFPDFVVRTLVLTKNGESRTIMQYHYISWPDHGVPESTVGTMNMVQ